MENHTRKEGGKEAEKLTKNDSFIIEGIDIVRTFKMGEVEVRALRGVPVKIRRGEFVAIMGPSGSGKTTLLNQLGLLDTPNSGKIIINGMDTSGMSEKEKGKFRLHNLGYVFQDYALLPELNAIENVYLSLMMQGKSKKEYESSASDILNAVGLGDRLYQLPSKMSGGQQQRVSVARALAHKPLILFADEPCANLDSAASKQVLDLFKKFNENDGQTIVMVTHEDWHLEYVDRVINLMDGMLVEKNDVK
ncbi:MAG: ABC transporter ATP-binding protein [Methanosarcinaceae archaeon]|nr:ABC transporter ATP-binding protein [Methanosarcinaceae archaeon]